MSNELIDTLIFIVIGGFIIGSTVWAILKVKRDVEDGPCGIDW